MASRYGRNKRRQAREQIAQLEQTISRKNDSIDNLNARFSSVGRWVERLERVVPQFSALKFNIAHKHLQRQQPEWSEGVTRMRNAGVDLRRNFLEDSMIDLERVRMLVMEVEAKPDLFDQALAFHVTFGDRDADRVSYAISEDLLNRCGIGIDEEEYIARDVARLIREHVNNHR